MIILYIARPSHRHCMMSRINKKSAERQPLHSSTDHYNRHPVTANGENDAAISKYSISYVIYHID